MSDITQIFGALSIGAISLLLLAYLAVFFLWSYNDWLSKLISLLSRINSFNKDSPLVLVLTLGLIPTMYGAGLIMQDYTDMLTDTNRERGAEISCNNPLAFWGLIDLDMFSSELRQCLGAEDTLRVHALVYNNQRPQVDLDENKCSVQRLNSLARELRDQGLVTFASDIYLKDSSPVLGQICDNNAECPCVRSDKVEPDNIVEEGVFCLANNANDKNCPNGLDIVSLADLKGNVARAYYRAHNWNYREADNHFIELELIQRQIDYTRSSFLIARYYIALAFWVLMATLIKDIRHLAVIRSREGSSNLNLRQFRNKYSVYLVVMAFIYLLGQLSHAGYQHSENNYNERVFGYFSSFCEAGGSRAQCFSY